MKEIGLRLHRSRLYRMFFLALACGGLAGCYSDPFANPLDWSMNGAPRENTALQVYDKSELLQGHGTAPSSGVAAAAGVDQAVGGTAGSATGLLKPPKEITFSSGTGS